MQNVKNRILEAESQLIAIVDEYEDMDEDERAEFDECYPFVVSLDEIASKLRVWRRSIKA